MSDVRLTATNPVDSSVVPVACNTRGELLVTPPVVEHIDNDLRIDGEVVIHSPSATQGVDSQWIYRDDGTLQYSPDSRDEWNHQFSPNGFCVHSRVWEDVGSVLFAQRGRPIQVRDAQERSKWEVSWDGTVSTRAVLIQTEPDNSAHYVQAAAAAEGEPQGLEYKGPVLDVAAELAFLRDQLRQTMERLKMTPEGGWEVWDGSD